jgi:AcrR family transcriptional regulator
MGGTREGRGRTPNQLPSGRHGLSPKFVARNQRERMMVAVADAVSRTGFAALTVEDVVARAGVSRRTFYAQFANKEEAFLASYDGAAVHLLANVQAAFAATTDFVERVTGCLAAFAEFVGGEPAFAHMCVVDVLGAGPEGIARRNGVLAAFAALLDAAAAELGTPVAALTSQTVVGGIHEVAYTRLLHGEADAVPALLPELLYSALLPYVGQERASQARREAARQRRRRTAASRSAEAGTPSAAAIRRMLA